MNKEKLLIISYKIPYPLNQGGNIAQYFFLKELVLLYDVTWCTIIDNEYQKNNLKELQKVLPDLKIIYQDQIIMNTSGVMLNYLIKLTKRVKNKIRVLTTKKTTNEIINSELHRVDNQFSFANEKFISFLNQVLANENYDLIQLEFFETLELLPFLPKESKKIVVHHEIRSKRNSLIKSPNTTYKNYLVESIKVIELALLDKADQIIVFNQNDKEYLQGLQSKIHISPFGIPDELILKRTASVSFKRFIFIGGENHFPNKEAVEWFLEEIYIPNKDEISWPIYVIGAWSLNTKNKYKNDKNIIFTGFLEDLSEIFENSVLLTPILSGSGIRTKILQAFANRIPVMSTKFASEGLFENSKVPNHLIHFKSAGDFVVVFEKMRNDMIFLTSIADNGFQYYSTFFKTSDLVQERLEVYRS